ncbi:GFA family protein [Mesorhizobium sp. VK9D]|uniref:GFA family protein n=1 Tax=Mesorhizobium australafricanum TaxID=3072311 RepID=UPI002A24EA4B|nr:GFA family protein [Mesorhizobium sp. VK9D]MDX8451215.1 GFA family protein [Mesorhizobium sp. VK9D]
METSGIRAQTAPVARTGGCLCGKVRYRVTRDQRASYCRCDTCRRSAGGAFAVLVWTTGVNLSWSTEEPAFRRSSPIAPRGFCPACASPLALARHELAHVGTFDNPAELELRYNYGPLQRPGWVCCGIDLPNRNAEERW